MAKVAFFGPGIMGEPMAGHLLANGHQVVVVPHRNRAPIDRLVARGAKEAAHPAEAAAQTDVAVMILPTSLEVEDKIFGAQGLASTMKPGYTIIDMSTSYPADTRRLAARLAAAGGRFLDAPVTGGPKGAREATLTIMVGGDAALLDAMRPVLSAMGKLIYRFGDIGAGHTAKLIQNLITIVANAAIAEGFALAAKAGLDLTTFFQMLSTSTANSPALQSVVPKVFSRDFDTVGFRLDLVYKDLKQAAAMAREIGVPLFATNGAVELLHLAKVSGFGEQDGSAVIRGLEKLLGLEVRGEVKKPGV
jgi:3-hydroxyisobutyrate dehydrogenase-like beta-hydroxyacid dehydrogenase